MPTDFPKQGDDLAVSLRNSEVPRFDYEFADMVRVDHPDIWDAGGNIRGNDAFGFWTRARQDDDADVVLDWIREREAWAARHAGDGRQFPDDPARMSNIAGVVAAMKWGVVLDIGMDTMKDAVLELIEYESEQERARVGEIDGTPVFSTQAEAEAEAVKMGCSGYHTHEFEGETVYMPCSSHGDATGGGGGYRNEKEFNDTMERRYFTTKIETRVEGQDDEQRIEGYAAIFDATADINWFTESIDRDAFADVINKHDCRALFNHDPNFPLARSVDGEGTLDLKVDDNGLWFSFPVGPQSYARDLHESIKRGDVNQASFAFTVDSDEWSTRDGRDHRNITKLGDLLDVAVVTYPAYEQTAVVARNVQPQKPSDTKDKSTTGQPPKWDKLKWSRAKLDALKHRKK